MPWSRSLIYSNDSCSPALAFVTHLHGPLPTLVKILYISLLDKVTCFWSISQEYFKTKVGKLNLRIKAIAISHLAIIFKQRLYLRNFLTRKTYTVPPYAGKITLSVFTKVHFLPAWLKSYSSLCRPRSFAVLLFHLMMWGSVPAFWVLPFGIPLARKKIRSCKVW